jgi:hypothetical protein
MSPMDPQSVPLNASPLAEVLAPYHKLLGYVFFAIVQSLITYGSGSPITQGEIGHTALTAFGLIVMYVLPNAPGAKYVKAGATVAIAALEVIVAALDAGADLTSGVWLSALMAVGLVLGVVAPTNTPEPAVPPTANTPAAA